MFARIRQIFRGVQFEYIPLVFELDLDESGKHVIRVCKRTGELRQPVTAIERLWTYGYREEIEPPHRIAVLKPEDRQILYALRSLNPTLHEDGRLIVDMTPQVLAYLRTKPNVEESERAKTWQVAETTAQPTVRVQFDPAAGIRLEVGYALGDDALVSAAQLEKTADGAYFKAGATFCRIPPALSPMAEQLLQEGVRQIPLDQVPAFLQKDLPTIKQELHTILSDQANSLQVLAGRLVPTVNTRSLAQPTASDDLIDFDIEYHNAGLTLRQRDLYGSAQHGYYRSSPTTWVEVDTEPVRAVQAKLSELGAVTTSQGYRLPWRSFVWLKDVVHALANPGSPSTIPASKPAGQRPSTPPAPAPPPSAPEDRFVEIVPGGGQERNMPLVRISVSYEMPGLSFLKEAQRLHGREESSAELVPFMQYWPTYSSMDKQQLRWYFYWRAQVRRGRFLPTDLSYIFVHIYELLNLVELPDVTQAAARLRALWHAYRPQHPKLDNYVPEWGGDLLAFKGGMDAAMAWWEQSALLSHRLSAPVVNTLVHFYVEAQRTAEMPYRLWAGLTAYRPRNKFYQEHNADGRLDRAYEQAIRTADQYWQHTENQSLLEKFTSARLHSMRKPLFASVLVGYPHPDTIDLGSTRDYQGDARLNEHLTAVVKYAENLLRKQERYPSKLSGIRLDSGLAQALEAVFMPAPAPVVAAPVRVVLDPARVASLHKESEEIGAILEPAESEVGEPAPSKALYTDLAGMRELWSGLDIPYRLALTAIFQKKIATVEQLATLLASNAILPNLMIDRVNEQAIKQLGDCLIYEENGGTLSLAEDFLDELDVVVKESPPAAASVAPVPSAAGSPWDEVFARLAPAEIELVRLFAQTGGLTEIEIENATRPYNVMANAALDRLNEKASDALGHPPLYIDGDKWLVEDDDLKTLREHLTLPETQ